MSEFDEKLEAILGNPDAMSQIMALAKSLGGNQDAQTPSASPLASPPMQPTSEGTDSGSLLGMLGELDPALIQTAVRLFSEFSKQDDQRAALLQALKPFLKEERYAKIDRAVQIARLSRVLRIAFQLFKGKGSIDV